MKQLYFKSQYEHGWMKLHKQMHKQVFQAWKRIEKIDDFDEEEEDDDGLLNMEMSQQNID